jgi:WD40 repeat protein
VDTLTFSSDGELLITVQADGKIRFFETDTFTHIGFLQYDIAEISAIVVSQYENGYWMILGGDNGIVQVWELEFLGR